MVPKRLVPNPFRHRDPMRDRDIFFNRDTDVRKVLTRLRKGQNVSVVGKEKIDRTSFLFQVSDPQVAARHGLVLQDHLFCYLDCKQLADLDDGGRFGRIKAVLEEVISDWEAPMPVPEDIACSDAYYWLDQTLSLLDRAGIQLTLQLDDFDWLAGSDWLTLKFLDNLRALSETHDALTYLATSSISLVELQSELPRIVGSPFFDIFWDYELRPLDPDESRRLLVAGLESVGVTFSEGVLEFIAHLSHGEPCRMQLVCACAYDVWFEKGQRPLCDGSCGEIKERFNQELKSACGDSIL
jgi:hypothetical protein